MTTLNKLSPELRGYINELQEQLVFLSDRAAGLASKLAKANETVEMQKGRISALEDNVTKLKGDQEQQSIDKT
jgi:hypothetical protein